MDVELSKNQANAIRQIAEKEGFVDFEIKTTPATTKGDNYMGIITAVSVNNHRKKLELILKAASTNTELRKVAPTRKAFVREIYVYNTIFPVFQKFEREENFLGGFAAHPKVYGSCDEELDEFLLFENLKATGYRLWNRKVPMDEEHVQLVCKEYGKFHAVSFAMKEKRPEVYEEIVKNLGNVFADTMSKPEDTEKMVKTVLDNGFKAIKGDQFATETMERFAAIAGKTLGEDILAPDEYSVILHGDCWCNNMMFKYEDPQDQKPSEVSLIDWQISWVGSPVLDLSYFLFTCASKEILNDHKRYLKIYHDSLCDTLRSLHCDPETLFPFSVLEDRWQKFASYGIYVSLMLLKLMVSDGSEVPDVAEIAESGKTFMEGFNFESSNAVVYNRRILDMVTVAGEHNLL